MSSDVPLIRLSINIPLQPANVPMALEFMHQFNIIVAGQSTLNYHLIPVTNRPIIYIPVYPYERDDFKEDITALIKKRINTLKEFISTYQFDKERKMVLHMLRNILMLRDATDTKKHTPLFKIENRETDTKESVDISSNIKLEYPTMKRYRLTDNSYISVVYDPYADDEHLVLCNLSKPFSEMGYQYNALHLYEHLMTYAWKDGNHTEEAYMNGITVVNGVSNVFSVLTSASSMMDYMHRCIDFILKGRDRQFWIDNKEILRTETMRTISETRASRSFSSPSRSDPAAYDCNYNTDIFCKWSNDPFDILLISNTDVVIDVQAINAKILSARTTKISLTTPSAAHIPVETFMDKAVVRIIKETPGNILNDLWNHRFGNVDGKLFGIDNYMLFPANYNINFDYRIHGLIYLHRFIKNIEEHDKLFLHNMMMPRDYRKLM